MLGARLLEALDLVLEETVCSPQQTELRALGEKVRRRQGSRDSRGGFGKVGEVAQGQSTRRLGRSVPTTTSAGAHTTGDVGSRSAVAGDSQRQRSHAQTTAGEVLAVAAAHGWPGDAGWGIVALSVI